MRSMWNGERKGIWVSLFFDLLKALHCIFTVQISKTDRDRLCLPDLSSGHKRSRSLQLKVLLWIFTLHTA